MPSGTKKLAPKEGEILKTEAKQDKQRRQIRNIAIIIGIVIIILLLMRCCCGCRCQDKDGPDTKAFWTGIDPDAVPGNFEGLTEEEIQALLNNKVEEGMMNIHMLVQPTFEDGKSAGNIGIYVEPQNREPQVVQILLKDTEELIYQSGIIPVGSRVEKGRLTKDLDAGIYPCIARFHRVDAETGEDLGMAEHEIMLTILN